MTNKEFLSLLKSDYLSLEKSVKTLFKDYTFIHSLFQFIPPEFFLVLFLSVCFLLILNSISSKTKQINLLISVLVSVGLCVIANKFTIGRYSGWIYIKVAAAILAPAYLFSLVMYILGYAWTQYKKNQMSNPKTLQQSLSNFHNHYNEASTYLHLYLSNKNVDFSEVKEKLLGLRLTTEGMLLLLESKKQNAEVETFAPIDHNQS